MIKELFLLLLLLPLLTATLSLNVHGSPSFLYCILKAALLIVSNTIKVL